jgi:hypothetical protein
MMEVLCSSKKSVLTRATWRIIQEHGILHSHCCENLKSYKSDILLSECRRSDYQRLCVPTHIPLKFKITTILVMLPTIKVTRQQPGNWHLKDCQTYSHPLWNMQTLTTGHSPTPKRSTEGIFTMTKNSGLEGFCSLKYATILLFL